MALDYFNSISIVFEMFSNTKGGPKSNPLPNDQKIVLKAVN